MCEREENERAEHEVRGVENRAFKKKKIQTGQRGKRKDRVSAAERQDEATERRAISKEKQEL